MSDERIPLEGVKASDLKIGDTILGTGGFHKVVRIDVVDHVGTRVFRVDRGMRITLFNDDPVARILPEPVAQSIEPADPARILVTACKLIANDETIKDGQTLAGYLLQLTRCGGAKPYEVKERTNEQ
jgi:hypothetical protein